MFVEHLLVPSNHLSPRDPLVNKTDEDPCPQGAYIPELINNKFPDMLEGNKVQQKKVKVEQAKRDQASSVHIVFLNQQVRVGLT